MAQAAFALAELIPTQAKKRRAIPTIGIARLRSNSIANELLSAAAAHCEKAKAAGEEIEEDGDREYFQGELAVLERIVSQ